MRNDTDQEHGELWRELLWSGALIGTVVALIAVIGLLGDAAS